VNILGINDLRELDLRDALSRNDLALIGRPFRLDRSPPPDPRRFDKLLSAPETAGLIERGLVTHPADDRSPETLSGGLTALPVVDPGLLAAWREVEEEFREDRRTEYDRLEEGFELLTLSLYEMDR